MKKAVITGMGVVSPLGCDLKRFWDRLTSGQSGIRPTSRFDASTVDSRIAGEVVEFDLDAFLDRKEQRRTDRFAQFGIAAADLALRDSGLDLNAIDLTRVATIVGSGIGGLETLEEQHSVVVARGPGRCSPFMIPQMIANMVGGLIAIRHQLKGPNYAVTSACATAAHAIGDALYMIRRGDADVVVAGGAEACVTPLGVGGFCSMKALSTRNDDPAGASRPFDAGRDGFVIAEGAGVLVLEDLDHARRRGARIYAEVSGFGMTCDAYHMTAPAEDGDGAARAMVMAMASSGMAADEVDYINAHGTSTQLNDKVETRAIRKALGEAAARRTMVSSTKSMTGHLLGAAGGIEAAACALALLNGIVPPTINLDNPDPACDLDYVPKTAREVPIRTALSNSLGFGGHNACVAFRRMEG